MAESFSVLLLLFLTLTRCPSYCRQDKENKEDKKRFGASIVHGEPAPIGRFPYMCSLRKRGNREHRCGGTLIRSKWVLTAAHCIDPGFRDSVGLTPVVYCGAYTSETNDLDFIFTAVEGHIHSSWTGDTDDGYDVGLLKLDRKSKAPLPGIDTQNTPIGSGEVLTALGWGRTDSQEIADTLQMAQHLHYVSPARCEQEVGDIFKEHMICAGLLNEDTCKGDSGGPLLIPDGPDGNITAGIPQTDLIVGVTSFGPEACDASVPGVYIRTSYMWEWIRSVLDGEEIHTQEFIDSSEEERPPSLASASLPSTSRPNEEPEASPSSVGLEAEASQSIIGPPRGQAEASQSFILPEPTDEEFAAWIAGQDEVRQVVFLESVIEDDNAAVLEAVLLEGLDPNARDDSGFLANSLISMGGQPKKGETLLHMAAEKDAIECTKVLLAYGAEVNALDLDGDTPLHYSGRQGSTATAKVLIAHGAGVNLRSFSGATPLHEASKNGHLPVARVLVDAGALKTIEDNLGNTPYDVICTGEETECSASVRASLRELLSLY